MIAFGKLAAITFSLVALFAFPLSAQRVTGSVNGTVQDKTGAVLPGADVVLENLGTNVEQRTLVTEEGTFSFPSVLPGRYALRVSMPSFETSIVGEFRLQVNEVRTIDVQLELGEVTDSVTVSAAATPLNKTDATLSTVIQNEEMEEIPLNGRHFTQLTILSPGAAPIPTGQQNTFTISTGGFSPAVNGMRAQMNNFTLDGMDNNSRFSNVFGASPPPDAIQEFNIQTHQSDAQASFAAGANINVATKSGTNDFHGSIWEFNRDDALTANNFFDNSFGRDQVDFTQNQYGFTAGGPAILPGAWNGREKKTYFFTYFEDFDRRRANTTQASVPDAAVRRGDFSQFLGPKIGTDGLERDILAGQIYDPFTTRPCDTCESGFIRDPFPNNVIPEERIHPVARQYLNFFYPEPNRATFPNLVLAQSERLDSWQLGVRIDHTFSEDRKVFGRYSQYSTTQTEPGSLPAIPLRRINEGINTMIGYSEILSPTFLVDLRLGYNRTSIPFRNAPQGDNFRNAVGDEFGFEVPGGFLPTGMLFAGGNFTGHRFINFELANPDDSFQGNVDFTKIAGNHSLNFGYKGFLWRHVTAPQGDTRLQFFADSTNQPGFVGTGEPLASFYLGLPATSFNGVFPFLKTFGYIHTGYFQDRWKVTSKLTLNLGLQYTFATQPQETDDEISALDYPLATTQPDATNFAFAFLFAAPNPITGEPPNAPRDSIIPPDKNDWAPRIGLAYAINNETVIRSGFGVFYDFNQNIVQNSLARKGTTRWPFGQVTLVSGINTLTPTSPINLDNPFPPARTAEPSIPNDTNNLFQRDPYAMNWNLGIQRQLPGEMALTLEYVGSAGRNLVRNKVVNLAPAGPGPIAPRRPLHNVGSFVFQDGDGRSNHNALQVKLERRFKGGLTFRSSYTYSKTLDFQTDANGVVNATPDLSIEYGPADFDLRHVYTFDWVYQLPFGRGRRFGSQMPKVLDWILGGWQSSGIISLRSGQHFNALTGVDNANTGNHLASILDRPNRVSDPQPEGFESTPQAFFDTNAFEVPEIGTVGTLTRNALTGPSFQNVDFSLQKNVSFTESAGLQFRAEFFNLFNHTNFGNPIASMTSPLFGQILSAFPARNIQLGLKFYW